MSGGRLRTVLLFALVVLLCTSLLRNEGLRAELRRLGAYVAELGRRVAALEVPVTKEREMSSTYMANVGGQPQLHTVTDVQERGETWAEFLRRHFQHVAEESAPDGPFPAWQ